MLLRNQNGNPPFGAKSIGLTRFRKQFSVKMSFENVDTRLVKTDFRYRIRTYLKHKYNELSLFVSYIQGYVITKKYIYFDIYNFFSCYKKLSLPVQTKKDKLFYLYWNKLLFYTQNRPPTRLRCILLK